MEAIQSEYADIAKHNIFTIAGDDHQGRPVIVFYACRLPPSSEINHQRLLAYLKRVLNQYVQGDYTLLYFHHKLTSVNKPSLWWLKEVYQELDRTYKKNIKALLIVHPSMFIRKLILLLRPLISWKFGQKLKYVNHLDELQAYCNLDRINIPEEILEYNRTLPKPRLVPNLPTDTTRVQRKTQQIGVPIESVRENYNEPIPPVLKVSVEHIRRYGLDLEGLFRRSVSQEAVRNAIAEVNAGKEPCLVSVEDSHLAATLIKRWLRDLPEPILGHRSWAKVNSIAGMDPEEQVLVCRQLMHEIPEANHHILKYIVEFLAVVAGHSESNRMTASNLAVVFGPNFIWSERPADSLAQISQVNHFAQLLILGAEQIFH